MRAGHHVREALCNFSSELQFVDCSWTSFGLQHLCDIRSGDPHLKCKHPECLFASVLAAKGVYNIPAVWDPSKLLGLKGRAHQQDAHEAAVQLFEKTCSVPSPSPESPDHHPIPSLFAGILQRVSVCGQCGNSHSKADPFGAVTLTVLKPDLSQSLLAFETPEVRDDVKNLEYCKRCKRNQAKTVTNTFRSWGALALIQLNRARQNGCQGAKDNTSVSFELECELKGQRYDLIAVVIHEGPSMHEGHFHVKIKTPVGAWMKIDGAIVTPCGARSVTQPENAYMLLYQVKNWQTQLLPPPVKPGVLGVVDLTGPGQQQHASTAGSEDTGNAAGGYCTLKEFAWW